MLLNSRLIKLTQDSSYAELRSTTTQKSATARETIIAGAGFGAEISSAVNEPRKIVNLFQVMVSNERNQPRIQNQVSIRINS